MKKKLFLILVAIFIAGTSFVDAQRVKLTTSCGIVTYFEVGPSDTMATIMLDVRIMDSFFCD